MFAKLLTGAFFLGVVFGAAGILGRWLISAFTREVAQRIALTVWGIKWADRCTAKLFRHARLSGGWKIEWDTDSQTFAAVNSSEATLYRIFDNVAVEGAGQLQNGPLIPYAFVGHISRGRSVITGTWFDGEDRTGGYHGAFQLQMAPTLNEANGLWIGFSQSGQIKSGALRWSKL